MLPHVLAEYEGVFTRKVCAAYDGARLKAEVLARKLS